jgi:hypothetical protein
MKTPINSALSRANLAQTRYTGASRSNPMLGGATAYTVATRVLRAGAPPDAIPTTVEDRLSRLPVASFPWSVFTAVSSQNEFLS